MLTNSAIDQWPTQDGIDRSGAIAVIASLRPTEDFRPSYPELREWHERSHEANARFESAVNGAVQELGVATVTGYLKPGRYQIGPASEGLITSFIVTLWESREYIGFLAASIDLATFTFRLVRYVKSSLHRWDATLKGPKAEVVLTLPPEMLVDLCQYHVRTNYHPRARLEREWMPLTQEFYGGYRSPAHPTSDMEYLVTIRTRSKEYVYRVMGNGEVTGHHMKHGRLILALPLPNLIESRS